MDDVRPLRVLLVDDDLPLRTLLRFALDRDDRFDVVGEAGDGHQALTEIGRCRPDLVLLDLAMPEMDGLEVLERLESREDAPAIVVLTGFADPELEKQSLAAGAVGYLTKGLAFEGFGDRVAEIVGAVSR